MRPQSDSSQILRSWKEIDPKYLKVTTKYEKNKSIIKPTIKKIKKIEPKTIKIEPKSKFKKIKISNRTKN